MGTSSPRMLPRSPSAEFTELLRKASGAAKTVRERGKDLFVFDVPPHMRRPNIVSGYRAHQSLRACLISLFELHNETINVWSHLVGCGIFVSFLYHVHYETCEALHCPERWPLYAFCMSAIICLSLSAVYHLVGTANEAWSFQLEKYDYAGIVTLIVGSCAPVVHYGFGPTLPAMRSSYMVAILSCGVVTIALCTSRRFERWQWTRILLFMALAFCGVVALLHAMIAHDYSPTTVALLAGVTKMGVMYLTGVLLYTTRFPESLVPRKFASITDIWGASHQWWHACVLAAACLHFRTVERLWLESAERMPFAARPP